MGEESDGGGSGSGSKGDGDHAFGLCLRCAENVERHLAHLFRHFCLEQRAKWRSTLFHDAYAQRSPRT